ncbi:MAG: PAS domain S-box protein [Deltaproteobacteria bacterium]|nr:PAS domain S-box protein [Deltaproteobacteria bacterium]
MTSLEAEAAVQQSSEKKPTDSELRYRAVVECSIQGIAVQRHGTVLFANAALATILGYAKPHDIIGQRVEDHIALEERDRLRRYLVARLRGESAPVRYECRGVKKDGTPIWLEVAPALVSWSGEPAIIISLIDITARKRAEYALQQSELLYRTVLKNIHDGVFLVQEAQILFVNEAGAGLVGAPEATLLGQPFLSLIAAESIDRVRDCLRYCEEYGQGPTLDDVFLLSFADDRHAVVQAQMVMVSHNERKAVLVTLRDMSVTKRAEETIKEEAEISAALVRVGR